MDLLIPEIGLVFWHTVSFLILLYLLAKYAWKPVLKAIKEREENIQSALDAAESAKSEMARLTGQNEQLLREARAERDSILKEAKILKDRIVDEAKTEARESSRKILEQAKQEIEEQKNRALADVRNQVSTLSLEIARKVLTKEFEDQRRQEAFVADLLEDVSLN